MTHTYAQTNIQLYEQLLQADYSRAALIAVRDCYEYSLRLFDGQYRASGKPFLNHLVGTASILATVSQPAEMLCAGLLHAAYSHGKFGFALTGRSAHRRLVRSAAGKEVEALVYDYTHLVWGVGALQRACRELETASTWERKLLLLRVCNELEDHLDRGMEYSNKRRGVDVASERLLPLRELAAGLGYGSLADALSTHMDTKHEAALPSDLVSLHPRSFFARPGFRHALKHSLLRLVRHHP